jgi:MFS family permease
MQIKSKITAILFVSVLVDFLEFTIILPLLPKILTFYGSGTGVSHVSDRLFDRQRLFSMFRIRSMFEQCRWLPSFGMLLALLMIQNGIRFYSEVNKQRNTIHQVLHLISIGIVGSLFSFLQFISSTLCGAASDRYGRKPVLLLSMVADHRS